MKAAWIDHVGPAEAIEYGDLPDPVAGLDWIRKLAVAIDRRAAGLPAAIAAACPDGVSLWWEALREPDFDTAIASLAESGRMVLMAGRDAQPPSPVGPFYVKRAKAARLCDVQGGTLAGKIVIEP